MTRVTEKPNSPAPINKEVLYYYDHLNRLVKRTIDADGAGSGVATSQYWAYDDGINALVQYEGSSASTLSHRYLWSDQVDEILSDEQVTSLSSGGNPLYAMRDHLASVRDIADLNESTGVTAIANHRTFNAYGKLISETNSAVDLLFAFTGKQLDEATNVQHNLNRWYDSGLGQWLSEDPLSFHANDENLRRYVSNRLAHVDPTGLDDPTDGPEYSRAQAVLERVKTLAEESQLSNVINDQGNWRRDPARRQLSSIMGECDCNHYASLFANYTTRRFLDSEEFDGWTSTVWSVIQPILNDNALHPTLPANTPTGLRHAYTVIDTGSFYFIVDLNDNSVGGPHFNDKVQRFDLLTFAASEYSSYRSGVTSETVVRQESLTQTIWEARYTNAQRILGLRLNRDLQNYRPVTPNVR